MTTTDHLRPADIGTVIEITVAPWGRPGTTLGWSGHGGSVLGRLVAVERGPMTGRLIAAGEDLGDEITTLHLEGIEQPLTFPSARLVSVQR